MKLKNETKKHSIFNKTPEKLQNFYPKESSLTKRV